MKRCVLVACLLLAGCSDPLAPATGTEPPTASPRAEPACPNEATVVTDDSLRTEGALAGDVDGDGVDENVTIYVDPAGEPGCQAFVVARSGDEVVMSGPLGTWRADFGLTSPTVNSMREVDGEPGFEVVVNLGAGASTQFVGIVTAEAGALRQVTSDVPDQPGSGLFGVGGSVGHLEAVDCAAGGRIVTSFAAPQGDEYRVRRTFLVFDGTALVEDDVEVASVPVQDLDDFPEYGTAPFGSCSG